MDGGRHMHTKGNAERLLLYYAHVNKCQSKYQKTFGRSERTFTNVKNPTMHSSFSL